MNENSRTVSIILNVLSLQIKDISNYIYFLKNRGTMRNELEKCLPQNIIIDLLKHQIVLNRFLNNDRGHIKKLNDAILEQSSAQKRNLSCGEKGDP